MIALLTRQDHGEVPADPLRKIGGLNSVVPLIVLPQRAMLIRRAAGYFLHEGVQVARLEPAEDQCARPRG